MDDLKALVPGAIVGEEVFSQWRNSVPPVLADTWKAHGFASIAAGFVRLVDPSSLQDLVAATTVGFEEAIPVFTTALADIGVFHDGRVEVLKYRHGRVGILPVDPDELFDIVGSPTGLEEADYLDWQPFPEAVERLGVPGGDECFGFTPLLVLGGSEAADKLDIVKLREHIVLITQFTGPLS